MSTEDSGDPSLVWRRLDGKFYYAALRNGGLGLYRSDDDCLTFTFVSQIASGNDDKEIMAIDNEPTSPFYGRIYIVWTDFGSNTRIFSTHSTNAGTSWSPQVALSVDGEDVQGAWPTIAPNGDVYVAWLHWLAPGFPSGNAEVQVSRSTTGGAAYTLIAPPMTNRVNPRDSAATTSCGRPALAGNIRNLPSPQIFFRGNFLHAVYSYDPNAFATGDASDIFFPPLQRRVVDVEAEVKINDDTTTTDQWQPTIFGRRAGPGDDRLLQQAERHGEQPPVRLLLAHVVRHRRTWQPSERLSDASSAIVLDRSSPRATTATTTSSCRTGSVARTTCGPTIAAARRRPAPAPTSRPIARWSASTSSVSPAVPSRTVCAPDDATYPLDVFQFQGFAQPVTIVATGNPAGSTVAFSANPVTPPGTSTATVTTAGVAAGSSTLTFTGTSAPGGIVHTVTAALTVFTARPARRRPPRRPTMRRTWRYVPLTPGRRCRRGRSTPSKCRSMRRSRRRCCTRRS